MAKAAFHTPQKAPEPCSLVRQEARAEPEQQVQENTNPPADQKAQWSQLQSWRNTLGLAPATALLLFPSRKHNPSALVRKGALPEPKNPKSSWGGEAQLALGCPVPAGTQTEQQHLDLP